MSCGRHACLFRPIKESGLGANRTSLQGILEKGPRKKMKQKSIKFRKGGGEVNPGKAQDKGQEVGQTAKSTPSDKKART